MAWIELHQSLPTHKKTLIASDILDIPPVHFMGHVAAFWLWCLDNVPDGNLQGISARMIARAAQWDNDPDKFVDALMEAGFLVQAETLTIHDWHDYAGKLVERRASEKERSKQRRAALKESEDNSQTNQRATGGRPADDQQTTDGTVPNRTVPNLTMDHENPPTPLGTRKPFRSRKQQDRFDQFWQRYPRKKSKGQAEKTWAKINPDEQLHEAILNGLERAKTSGDWQKNNGEFIPHPATWLNAKGWEDEHESSGAPNDKPLTEQRRKEIELIKELYHT